MKSILTVVIIISIFISTKMLSSPAQKQPLLRASNELDSSNLRTNKQPLSIKPADKPPRVLERKSVESTRALIHSTYATIDEDGNIIISH